MPDEEAGRKVVAMYHPRSRCERRFVRFCWIMRRRFIVKAIWRVKHWEREWGYLSKWNLNCGCRMCHCNKYYGDKRKRRRNLNLSGLEKLNYEQSASELYSGS